MVLSSWARSLIHSFFFFLTDFLICYISLIFFFTHLPLVCVVITLGSLASMEELYVQSSFFLCCLSSWNCLPHSEWGGYSLNLIIATCLNFNWILYLKALLNFIFYYLLLKVSAFQLHILPNLWTFSTLFHSWLQIRIFFLRSTLGVIFYEK